MTLSENKVDDNVAKVNNGGESVENSKTSAEEPSHSSNDQKTEALENIPNQPEENDIPPKQIKIEAEATTASLPPKTLSTEKILLKGGSKWLASHLH